ncbi:hypothetical protein B0H19DRAFT_1072599 [Mycena capillaripes]|nr:hypothetical protein B0H19DRAFT_1072599 [Mycena capillaripes]
MPDKDTIEDSLAHLSGNDEQISEAIDVDFSRLLLSLCYPKQGILSNAGDSPDLVISVPLFGIAGLPRGNHDEGHHLIKIRTILLEQLYLIEYWDEYCTSGLRNCVLDRPHFSLLSALFWLPAASSRKDRATILSIHLAPPHLSKEDFVAQLNGAVDELIKIPIAQKNSLKFEMLIPNDELGSHLDACGLQKQKLVICLVWGCESEAHYMEDGSSKPVLAVGIFKLPEHMSAEKFYESARAHTIAFAELPVVQKYQLVNYILWTPNDRIEQRFKEMGRSPTVAPIVQIMGAQLLSDPDHEKLFAEVMEKFRFGSDSYCFGADVITKFNRV